MGTGEVSIAIAELHGARLPVSQAKITGCLSRNEVIILVMGKTLLRDVHGSEHGVDVQEATIQWQRLQVEAWEVSTD